jgi:hypothetical protein
MAAASDAPWRLVVAHGKIKLDVACLAGGSGTVHELKLEVERLTALPPEHQRLLYKGKERADGETLLDSGLKNGGKLLLMVSKQRHLAAAEAQRKQAQQRVASEVAGAKAAIEGGDGAADAPSAKPSPSEMPHDGAAAPAAEEPALRAGGCWVVVSHGKRRYEIAVESCTDCTVGDLQAKLSVPELSNVAPALQRLVYKGSMLGNREATLEQLLGGAAEAAAGKPKRYKMVLLGSEGLHAQEDEGAMLATAGVELEKADAAVQRVGRLLDHRGIGAGEAALELGVAEDTVGALLNRLQTVGAQSCNQRAVRPEERAELQSRAEVVAKLVATTRRRLQSHSQR